MFASAFDVLRSLLDPFLLFVTPGERIYWPFLLVAVVMGWGVFVLRRSRLPSPGAGGLVDQLFSRRIWFSNSSWLDVQILFAKALFRGVLLSPWWFSKLALGAVVASLLAALAGERPPLECPFWVMAGAFTLVSFLAEDWSRYALHRLFHRVPWLWELHKVHHSAEVLTPLTLYRTHPIESFLYSFRELLVLGPVVGVFYYLFGSQLDGFAILGVDALGFLFNMLGANLRHTHLWLSYGPRVERWLISPAQHQLHHSQDPAHHDSNYGSFLACWDRMSGSLLLSPKPTQLRFGLDQEERNHGDGLLSVLWHPLHASVRSALRLR